MTESADGWEIEAYFFATLRELNLPLPDKRCAALTVAKAISEEIISGTRPVWEGVQKLLDEAINRYSFEEEDKKYVYDGICFSEVYGLFYSIDELPIKPAWPRQKTVSFEVQVSSLEQKLLQALRKWQAWLDHERKNCP